MRAALNAVLVVVLAAAALAGTAALSSLHGASDCGSHLDRIQEGASFGTPQPFSLWPPGVHCELVDAQGAVLDSRDPSATSFLALLVLELGLALVLRRGWPRVPFVLRAATVAVAALLTCGLGTVFFAFPGGWLLAGLLVAPIVGLLVDRRLRRAGSGPARADGGAGGLITIATVLVGMYSWIFFQGPLGHVVTVALVAAGAAAVRAWAGRSQPLPAWMA